ncbi:LytR/AlgR family response regulator transcription factor [Maribacter antarcticus]|uniref:LytR/AlgR family response regulator transcription factor n=1 Tax=Maribacter antarcticus TaxID=505250 RepID=UPI00047B16A0|nr:response regulator [Maribacter antarcticus]
MEKNKIRILIVEDDMIIGANVSLLLTNLGYDVTGLVPRGEEAVVHVRENPPHILLLDINLKGNLNGIDTAKAIQKHADIPIIYLTANSDNATFELAKETRPKAFITKPFNKLNLERTLELVVQNLGEVSKSDEPTEFEVLHDRIFVRHKGRMVKLLFEDILYVEADRNYCKIVEINKEYTLSSSLKTVSESLPDTQFIKVHRSYMVNIFKLDVLAEDHLEINRKWIPLSKSHKKLLMKRLRTI